MCDVKTVLWEYGVERGGKKAVLAQRLTTKLMILYQIPGRETFNRMCYTINQMIDFSPHIRVQAQYPFKLFGVNYDDAEISFENLVEASRNAVCDIQLSGSFTHLRDMTPALSCPFAYGRWVTITLQNSERRPNFVWMVVFTDPKILLDVEYQYDIKFLNSRVCPELLLMF